ncbi:glycine zipper 2TM domain-containing protein [Massilia sp. CF038]|uniref:glycine zipper 2TM domain-containing protein n=1 Tax=Massilia sp. CF038 TaxID=1881045 RepID=UPI00091F6B0A|nr:glycine zipper 2TM domain-containing protein [Massilia sp. CF038]SHH07727.1 Glycine zipper 2TM domain-containing protein [Massilia sp. CF038]
MHTPNPQTAVRSNYHPLWIAAAIAIIVFCLAGTAAILGWLPSSITGDNRGELTASDRAALAANLAPAPAASNAVADAERARQDRLEQDRLAAERERDREQARAAERRREVKLAAAAPARKWCGNCGNVESVREIRERGQGSGLGAAGGAVIGGLLGNQVGGGNGRKLATVAGAVGGAVVGNQVEGNMKATQSWEIRVRLDDGSARTFQRSSLDGYSTGDRVKVVDGKLHHMQ